MKGLAYVSDEMYVALPDVAGEFESEQTGEVTILRSSPRGAFYGDLEPGRYRVTLSKEHYGSKISTAVSWVSQREEWSANNIRSPCGGMDGRRNMSR